MKKVFSIKTIVFIALLAIMAIALFSLPFARGESAFASDEEKYNEIKTDQDNFSPIVLETQKARFIGENNVYLRYRNIGAINFIDYQYEKKGMDISFYLDKQEQILDVVFGNLDKEDNCGYILKFFLENGNHIDKKMFVYANDKGIFIAEQSMKVAFCDSLYYEMEKGEMDENELDNMIEELSDGLESINPTDQTRGTNSVSFNFTYHLKWDDGIDSYYDHSATNPHFVNRNSADKIHNLYFCDVELVDQKLGIGASVNVITTERMSTVGSVTYQLTYYYTKTIFATHHFELRAYAGHSTAKVFDSTNKQYYHTFTLGTDLTGNYNTNGNYTFTMSSNEGQAMQISQAICLAEHYANEMTGTTMPTIKVIYPAQVSGSYYNNNIIRIPYESGYLSQYPNSYADWDSNMHEYGHHVQQFLSTNESLRGTHHIDSNMSDVYRENAINNTIGQDGYAEVSADDAKYYGDRIAWAEAWATLFGFLAQNANTFYNSHVVYSNDLSYVQYNGIYLSYLTCYNLANVGGEAVEQIVLSYIWRLYGDSSDGVSLTREQVWQATTEYNLDLGRRPVTFSDCFQNLLRLFPSQKNSLYNLLDLHSLCPNASVTEVSISGVLKYRFELLDWLHTTEYGYRLNYFEFVFFDYYGDIIYVHNIGLLFPNPDDYVLYYYVGKDYLDTIIDSFAYNATGPIRMRVRAYACDPIHPNDTSRRTGPYISGDSIVWD